MDYSLTVEDQHFEYLRLQKGRLDKLAGNRAAWHRAYEADLRQCYEQIAPHLPPACWAVLDIGSGLGGIDVLIRRHYEAAGGGCYVHLLDGESDPPAVRLHRETFNDMAVARDFQKRNGLKAERFGYFTPKTEWVPRPYDLVVSFGSWCFHYAPAVYLPLLRGTQPGAVLIVDLRVGKPEWAAQLEDVYELVAVVGNREKWRRCVYRRK